MGKLKQLLPLADKSAVHHCIDALVAAGIEDITVVIGQGHDEIRKALCAFSVRIAVNERAGSEMAESVRAGLAACPSGSGYLICLADHPLVLPETIRTLLEVHGRRPDRIVIPRYYGKRGHPCLFPESGVTKVFSGLNLREIVAAEQAKVEYLEVDDEGVVLDMDTEEEYRVMLEKFGKRV